MRAAPSAAQSVPPGALRVGGRSAGACSWQRWYLTAAESRRRLRESGVASDWFRPLRWTTPSHRGESRCLLPTTPTSLIKAGDCRLPTLLWLVESRGLGGVAQAVQEFWAEIVKSLPQIQAPAFLSEK